MLGSMVSLSQPSLAMPLNLPHLGLLAALPAYLWLSASWPDALRLSVGTLLGLAWLMAAERLWPHRPAWQADRPALQRDATFLGIGAVTDSLGAAALTALALAWAPSTLLAGLPGLLAWPLAVALGELGPWALHRWAHRGGWGWQVHALHHRPQQLNAANAVLVHPLNLLWNQAARQLPWWLLGFDPQVLVAAALFLQLQSLAVHANLRGSLGPLRGWIGSAELHRWHHSLDPAEAQNFGTALPLWDRLAGSFHAPGGEPRALGVAGLAPPRLDELKTLLLHPVCRCLH